MKFSRLPAAYQGILKAIYKFAKENNVNLYLVGGFLRDIVLNRQKENPDFDFCLRKDSINFGRRLAKEIRAGFVVLDKEHGACRLVKKIKDKTCTFDFTDFRGATLTEDLLHRDFTINCLALELKNVFQNKNIDNFLIDHYGGKRDLELKIIRITNKEAFDEDPLRILRAFSLAAIFAFKIDKEALKLIRLKKNKLSEVSPERVRDELCKILDQPAAFAYLSEMDKIGILKAIIPELEVMRGVEQGPYHHLDVWQHSLETLRQLEGLIRELRRNQELQTYLREIISSERKRYVLIKLSALLHDIGKPAALRHQNGKTTFHGHERIGIELAEDIVRRLRLSNDELNSLNKMILWHLRPGYLADNPTLTSRAKFRYFRDTAQEAVSTLMLSIADQRATKGRLTSKQSRMHHEKMALSLIAEFFRKQKEKKLPRLLTGDDLIKKFKLAPSPLIGKILSEVEELQAIGKIKDKKEALAAAGRFI